MREAHSEFAASNISVMAVGTAAPFQAEAMAPDLPFPLLLDPEFEFREALSLTRRLSWRQMAAGPSTRNYLGAMRGGSRQGMATPAHMRNRPAVVVLDGDLRLRWGHEGEALGDYAPIDEVVAAARAVSD